MYSLSTGQSNEPKPRSSIRTAGAIRGDSGWPNAADPTNADTGPWGKSVAAAICSRFLFGFIYEPTDHCPFKGWISYLRFGQC